MVWYPGEQGGVALADVLFGDYNPSGRLPITFPKSLDQLPAFGDYRLTGRTYRFMTETPQFYFGFGLSYTTFGYSDLSVDASGGPAVPVEVTVTVKNTGNLAGSEVVQAYVKDQEASVPVPHLRLVAYQRVTLEPGESKTLTLSVPIEELMAFDDDGKPFLESGLFELSVGGGQPVDPHYHVMKTSFAL
jgi:beta-glucosidase